MYPKLQSAPITLKNLEQLREVSNSNMLIDTRGYIYFALERSVPTRARDPPRSQDVIRRCTTSGALVPIQCTSL